MRSKFNLPIIPNFLVKKLYLRGSLRIVDEGAAFDLRNVLGPGIITKINLIKLNNKVFDPSEIRIIINEKIFKGDQITPNNPIFCSFNQKGTCILLGHPRVNKGKNNISVELVSREAGLIQVSVTDNLNTSV